MCFEIELKKIPKVDKKYVAGSDGYIYSYCKEGLSKPPKRLKGRLDGSGRYFHVSIVTDEGCRKTDSVHALICSAFHGEKESRLMVVSHLDGDCKNNIPSNLKWTTQKENLSHRFLHGTSDSGVNNSRASFDANQLFVCRWLIDNSNLSHKKIAEILDVQRGSVSKVANRSRYSNVEVWVEYAIKDNKPT